MLDMKLAADLPHKLEALNGYDSEVAEREERATGNVFTTDISFSKGFQVRLAARALSVPMQEIQELPLRDYNMIATQVFNFLFAPSAKDVTQQTNSEK